MHTADLQSAREGVARYCRRNPDANATAMQIIASFFPHQHAIPKNYFELSSKAAEAVDAHVERCARPGVERGRHAREPGAGGGRAGAVHRAVVGVQRREAHTVGHHARGAEQHGAGNGVVELRAERG